MIYKTKVGKRGGSLNSVIPSAIARALHIDPGVEIKWVLDMSKEIPTLCVEMEEGIKEGVQ